VYFIILISIFEGCLIVKVIKYGLSLFDRADSGTTTRVPKQWPVFPNIIIGRLVWDVLAPEAGRESSLSLWWWGYDPQTLPLIVRPPLGGQMMIPLFVRVGLLLLTRFVIDYLCSLFLHTSETCDHLLLLSFKLFKLPA
jgi:hypothetical protein